MAREGEVFDITEIGGSSPEENGEDS